jgi:hypothetical protein
MSRRSSESTKARKVGESRSNAKKRIRGTATASAKLKRGVPGGATKASASSGGTDATIFATFLQEDSSQGASIHAEQEQLRFQNPWVYVLGRPITITTTTTFNGFSATTDMASFFKNAPYASAYRDCGPPGLSFSVTQNPDGSLTASSVALEYDDC